MSLGQRPRIRGTKKPLALKARISSGNNSIIIGAMPQSLSKVILHIVFSPDISLARIFHSRSAGSRAAPSKRMSWSVCKKPSENYDLDRCLDWLKGLG